MAKLSRIHLHWTAGGHSPNAIERAAYHFLIDADGRVHTGDLKPEANISTTTAYAAHTRQANTGAIGVALCGMLGAQERPFDAGSHPIAAKQITAMVDLVADLADGYGIPVTRETILTHAEVQRTLGIRQNAKWDITWLPGMNAPGDPIAVGDVVRARVRDKLRELELAQAVAAPPVRLPDQPIIAARHAAEARPTLPDIDVGRLQRLLGKYWPAGSNALRLGWGVVGTGVLLTLAGMVPPAAPIVEFLLQMLGVMPGVVPQEAATGVGVALVLKGLNDVFQRAGLRDER